MQNAGNISLRTPPILDVADTYAKLTPEQSKPMVSITHVHGCLIETWPLEQLARCSHFNKVISPCQPTELAQEKMTLKNQQRYARESCTGLETIHNLI